MNEDKASRYHRIKRRSAVALAGVTAAGLVVLLAGGSLWLRDVAMAVAGSGVSAPSTVAVYALLFTLGYQLCTLPLTFFESFVLERRYGLSSAPLRAWIADHLKAAVLLTVFALVGAEIVYLALNLFPKFWWAASGAGFVTALILLARIAPTVLLPFFYRFKPLDRSSLQEKLVSLSTRARVPVLGVYEWGLGAKTRRANAALVGTGSTRRILLSDTLLTDYTDEEIEVILAHELGHHVNRDIRSALLLESGLLAASFAVAEMVLSRAWQPLGLSGTFRRSGPSGHCRGRLSDVPCRQPGAQRDLASKGTPRRRVRPHPDRAAGGVQDRNATTGFAEPRRRTPVTRRAVALLHPPAAR